MSATGRSSGDADVVLLSVSGSIARLTLNRPDKLNALVPEMFVSIREHLSALAEADVSVLIVEGAGRSFCAGHDLDAIASGSEEDLAVFEAEVIDLLENVSVPTIGKVRGHCLTGGLELALACDLLVCADDSKFADTHGKWGLVPVWGMTVRLPERVGLAKAKELSFTSRVVTGHEAQQIGLVNRSVPGDELDAVVDEIAQQMCGNSRESNRLFKAFYNRTGGQDRQDRLVFERQLSLGAPSDGAARVKEGTRKL